MFSSEKLHDLLRRCTVGICLSASDNSFIGTGFFVGQGLILTCAHVVKGRRSVMVVMYDGQAQTAEFKRHLNEKYPDVALLQMKRVDYQHNCVRLVPSIETGNEIFAFGYRQQGFYAGGVDVLSRYKGKGYSDARRQQPLLRLDDWQQSQGLSGGAILNRHTGAVVGIVASEIFDAGEGVPIDIVLQAWPEVANANLDFHAGDREWRSLEPEQDITIPTAYRALVIGNGWFPYRQDQCFPSCVQSAEQVYQTLRPYFKDITLLINHDATAARIQAELKRLHSTPARASNLVFWSGKGYAGSPYQLQCYDTNTENEYALSIMQLKDWLLELEACDQSLLLCLDVGRFPIDQITPLVSTLGCRCAIITWQNGAAPDQMAQLLIQALGDLNATKGISAIDLCGKLQQIAGPERCLVIKSPRPWRDFIIIQDEQALK